MFASFKTRPPGARKIVKKDETLKVANVSYKNINWSRPSLIGLTSETAAKRLILFTAES